MTDTIHTTQLTEAEMRAYESGRKAGLREAAQHLSEEASKITERYGSVLLRTHATALRYAAK